MTRRLSVPAPWQLSLSITAAGAALVVGAMGVGAMVTTAGPGDIPVIGPILFPEDCGTASPSASPSAGTPSASPTASASASASPSASPDGGLGLPIPVPGLNDPAPAPSASASTSPTPTPTATIGSPTPSPSATPCPSPSVSASPSSSPKPSTSASPVAASPTVSATPTSTPSPTPTAEAMAPQPVLRQSHNASSASFTFSTLARYEGKTVYFFRKSGQTGKVQPLGTAKVSNQGFAIRILNGLKPGQIIRAYAKVMDAENIQTPYSNDVSFKTG